MSGKALYLAFTEPVPGREAEYEDWYTNRHLGDIVALEGFHAAQRFKLTPANPGDEEPEFSYLAVYEIDADRFDAARAALDASGIERSEALAAGRPPLVPLSEALGKRRSFYCVPVSERIVEPGAAAV
jgi:hypothetical protein